MAKKTKGEEKRYIVHSDGSSLGNPGPSGYGAVVRLGDKKMTLSKGFFRSTNNRMEIMSVIATLEEFGPNKRFDFYVDSAYTLDGATKWVHGWRRNNWLTRDGRPVKNKDLWIQLYELMRENSVRIFKVKGHSGVPDNEEADQLANAGSANPTETDAGFIE